MIEDWTESLTSHNDDFDWKLWFAWYPVKADDLNGEELGWFWFTNVWWCKLSNGKNYYVVYDPFDDDDDFGTAYVNHDRTSGYASVN